MRVVVPGAETRARLTVLPPAAKKAIRAALDELARGWPTPDLEIKLLDVAQRATPIHRVRVGDWRFAVEVVGHELRIVHVFHRKEGYGWMERL